VITVGPKRIDKIRWILTLPESKQGGVLPKDGKKTVRHPTNKEEQINCILQETVGTRKRQAAHSQAGGAPQS